MKHFMKPVIAAAESTQVESALSVVIVEPLNRDPDSEASFKANSAEDAIAGVKDSIGPVNPKIIPTLISCFFPTEGFFC